MITIFNLNQLCFILISTLHCLTGSSSLGHYQLILPFGQYQYQQADCILLATASIVKIAPSKSIHRLPISSSTNSIPRYLRRLQSKPPKSSFKSLLIVTSLLQKSKQHLTNQKYRSCTYTLVSSR